MIPTTYPRQFSKDLDFPFYDGHPEVYLIASTPRCGSHFLGHLLLGTRYFGAPLEYLNSGNLRYWMRILNEQDLHRVLNLLIRRRTSPSGWFGIKTHWDQFQKWEEIERFDPTLRPRKYIWIYRKDILSQSISYLIAKQSGAWIEGAPMRARPEYSYKEIAMLANRIRKHNLLWLQYFKRSHVEVKLVAFEDIVGAAHQIKGIMDFLDPAYRGTIPVPGTQKQSDKINGAWKRNFLMQMEDTDRWIADGQAIVM